VQSIRADERRLRAREDDDAVRLDLARGQRGGVRGDGREQLRLAAGGRVARAAGPEARYGALHDGGRCREVRLADREHDHVAAGGLPAPGEAVHLPRAVLRGGEAVGERGQRRLHSAVGAALRFGVDARGAIR
jgi:hypothetical protein